MSNTTNLQIVRRQCCLMNIHHQYMRHGYMYHILMEGWIYGQGGTGHQPKGVKHKVKRPELRKASKKMSAPSRAPRLQYHHIVVFVRGRRGEGRKREGGKSWKVCWKGRRDDCLFDAGSEMAYAPYNKRNKPFSLLSFQCWKKHTV